MRKNIESRIQECRSKLENIDRQIFEELSKPPGDRRSRLLIFLWAEKRACSSALVELSALLQDIGEPVIDNGFTAVEPGKLIQSGILERKFQKTPKNKKIYRIIYRQGGFGHALLMTPAFRALKQRDPSCRIYVYCLGVEYDVFRNNRYIDRLIRVRRLRMILHRFLRRLKLIEIKLPGSVIENGNNLRRVQFLYLHFGPISSSFFMQRHFGELFGKEQIGIEVDDPRPNCFLTESEEKEGEIIVSKYVNPVAIQITGASSQNKNWPLENWEELVSNNPDYSFIQLGLANEKLVKGAVDLRGTTSIRQAFAIVKASKAFVGIDSVFAHAAAAFHIPSVVLFGPATPAEWGYQWNQNLYNPPPCSPCLEVLLNNPCPYGKQCMLNITVSHVENALRALSTATDTILDSASS